MKHGEQVKLDNFREQYRVLLRNNQEANSVLETSIKNRDAIRNELLICEKELKEALRELATTVKKAKEIDKVSNNQRRGIETREKELKISSEETLKDIKTSLGEFEEEKSRHFQSILLLNRDLSDLQKEYDILSVGSKTLQDIYTSQLSEKETLDRSLNQKKGELISKELEMQEVYKNLSRQIKTREDLLVKLEEKIQKEQSKVGLAGKALTLREKEIIRKEMDIKILTKRLKDLYQQVRPGISLKI